MTVFLLAGIPGKSQNFDLSRLIYIPLVLQKAFEMRLKFMISNRERFPIS